MQPPRNTISSVAHQSRPFVRPLQRCDVELPHLQKCLGDPRGLFGIGVHQHVGKDRRHDLPGHAIAVLQPAARALFATLGEPGPVVIDLVLRLAMHLERDGLVELELRSAVQAHEALPFDLELDGHDRARLAPVDLMPLLAVAADPQDPGVPEDGHIGVRRLLGLGVEPQARRDPLCRDRHGLLLCRCPVERQAALVCWGWSSYSS